jgi:S1-C subfamily serine protease
VSGLSVGDLIVEFAGVPVTGIDALHRLLDEAHIGQPTPCVVIRSRERRQLVVVPAETPARRARG